MSISDYADQFASLNTGKVGDHRRPHKPVMLLAIMALVESGQLTENRIEYGPELLEFFNRYFEVVQEADDQPSAYNPFYYLKSDGFLFHQPKAGMERAYPALRPRSARNLQEFVDYAYLDDELFELLQEPQSREELRQVLLAAYFADHRQDLLARINEDRAVAAYQEVLESQADGNTQEILEEPPEYVRDTAFARIVRNAYDFRCAACGLRVVLDDIVLVDAAHLVPFAESHDDDPRNGMALCKNHHWAMDRSLIAPCPDLKWHVTKDLDPRIADHEKLITIDRQKIILPAKPKYQPKAESLQWRKERLRS